jgi:hypothetical protein
MVGDDRELGWHALAKHNMPTLAVERGCFA